MGVRTAVQQAAMLHPQVVKLERLEITPVVRWRHGGGYLDVLSSARFAGLEPTAGLASFSAGAAPAASDLAAAAAAVRGFDWAATAVRGTHLGIEA